MHASRCGFIFFAAGGSGRPRLLAASRATASTVPSGIGVVGALRLKLRLFYPLELDCVLKIVKKALFGRTHRFSTKAQKAPLS